MTTLFVGNLPWETTEAEVRELFAPCGTILRCEVPVGRQGRSRGYALVDFSSGLEASSAVTRLHGHRIGEREITVRTDDKAAHTATKPPKASAPGRNGGGGGSSAGPPAADGVRCYFGNLSWETTDADVQAHAQAAGTVVRAEVARQSTNRSKGWALVDYASPAEAASAIATLHNTELGGRPIIVRLERAGPAPKAERAPRTSSAPAREENSSGCQIVVRNLPWTTTSEDLREVFQQVGTVVNATSVCHEDSGRSKGWGTVLFETAEQAAAAIAGFNGVELEGRAMVIKVDRFQ